jgi:hypothetical protein
MFAKATAANQQLGEPIEHRVIDFAFGLFPGRGFSLSCHSATLRLLQAEGIAGTGLLPCAGAHYAKQAGRN